MGRKANWPPKIHRHPSGNARVTYKNRDYYLGPYGSPEAEAAYADLLVQLQAQKATAGSPAKGPSLTVADVVAQFLTAAEREQSDHQLKTYRKSVGPLVRLCGHLSAADFDAQQLERVRAAMVDGSWMNDDERASRVKRGQETRWARTTVNLRTKRIVALWRWAERHKLVPVGSWANLRTMEPLRRGKAVREVPRRRGSTRADLDKVLPLVQPRCKRRPCACMLELQWILGCRSGEICIMRPCDIEHEGPIYDGIRIWLFRPASHKTEHHGHGRVIALGPAAQKLLAPWLTDCPPEQYVFRTGGGRPFTTNEYGKRIWRAAKRAGIRLSGYCGRHATADRVKRAFGLEGAKAILGHSSIVQTNEYGEQIDMELAAKIAAKLG